MVTPSFNQGEFLEETLRSVLLQGYPNLEYIVVDGGSNDRSREILRRYDRWLTCWVSEPDLGQYDAIAKGFSRSTGEVMGWINSDDKLVPWALQTVGELFSQLPEVEWMTSLRPVVWDSEGRERRCRRLAGHHREAFQQGEYVAGLRRFHTGFIQQESTFWRRALWDLSGARFDTSLKLAADFELWARFYETAELYGVRERLGGFRVHPAQRTARFRDAYVEEARMVLQRADRPVRGVLWQLQRKLLTRLPAPLRRLASLAGLMYPGREVRRCTAGGRFEVVRTQV